MCVVCGGVGVGGGGGLETGWLQRKERKIEAKETALGSCAMYLYIYRTYVYAIYVYIYIICTVYT